MNSLQQMRQGLAAMSPVEQKIASCILENPADAVNETIGHLGQRAGVSVSSIVNFAVSLGYKGFSELKINMAQHLTGFCSLNFDNVTAEDAPKAAMRKMIDNAAASFACTYDAMGDELANAARIFMDAKHIEVYGAGSSLPVAHDAYYRLKRLGLPVEVLTDPLLACLSASQLPEASVVLAISHKGRTVNTLNAVEIAKKRGASVIALTSYAGSPLAEIADIRLISISDEATAYREAVVARLTQLLMVDSICAYITAQKGMEGLQHLDNEIEVLEMCRKSDGYDK